MPSFDFLRDALRDRLRPNVDESDDDETTTHPKLDHNIIDEFLKLSKNVDPTDVNDRLRVFRGCNTTYPAISHSSSTKKDVDDAAIPLLCAKVNDKIPTALDKPEVPDFDDANISYVRFVDVSNDVAPSLEDVFDNLAKGDDRQEHPAGISSLAFAFGSLISLCISSPSSSTNYNTRPGTLSLAPLYGPTPLDNSDIRPSDPTGRGMLLPDAFWEPGQRLEFLPKATTVLLLLFSRNHNYIAKKLLDENEHGTWADPATLTGNALEKQDDEIFELARRINCGLFRNIVAHDFLKGLLGFSSFERGPNIDLFGGVKAEEVNETRPVGVEFSLLYNWYATTSLEDASDLQNVITEELYETPPKKCTLGDLDKYLEEYKHRKDWRLGERPCVGVDRDPKTKAFPDSVLASILQNATASSASAFRSRGTPSSARVLELAAMRQARVWKVCGLNDLRRLLGLPVYRSFEEWCSNLDVVAAAKKLYGDIDKLELYPGIQGEKALSGDGFCVGKTLTQGLIVDLVGRVRSDLNFATDFNPETLTKWGIEELSVDHHNGAFGAFLPKLLLRNLPNHYTPYNVFGLFPFATPAKVRSVLGGNSDYTFPRPVPQYVKTINNPEAVESVLKDPSKYPSPYGYDLQKVTPGEYGYLLGFDDPETHDNDEFLTLKSLIPDRGALDRFAHFYKDVTERLIRQKSERVNERYQVDIIDEVINGVSTLWVAERLCGLPLNSKEGFSEKELFEKLLNLNNHIFGNAEPEERFSLRARARKGSEAIVKFIKRHIIHVTADPENERSWSSLLLELLSDEIRQDNKSHDFLARLASSGRANDAITANALGLAVMSSIPFAQTCGAAVRFYLDDARAKEREILRDLSKQEDSDQRLNVNQKIMGYIRESMRLNPQIPFLQRNVAEDHILHISEADSIALKKGDRIHAFTRNPDIEPTEIDPDRETRFLQGAGFHKCIGIHFVEKTMPEVFKAIFRLEDLRFESKKKKGGSRSLVVSYLKPKDSPPKVPRKKKTRPTPFIQRACDSLLIVLGILILYWVATAAGNFVFNLFGRRSCGNARHLRAWDVYTMLPGPDNRTAPFFYTAEHPNTRRISFVDIDARDSLFEVYVDGKRKGISSDFEADKSVDCGVDAEKCVAQGFSKGSVIVPPGKHTVRIEWAGKEFVPGTNIIDWGPERSRRFMWKQELC